MEYIVRDHKSLFNIIIPHFDKYPLRGIKYLDYLSFKEACNIFASNSHRTQDGFNTLLNLSRGMNTYRIFPNNEYYLPDHANVNSSNYLPLDGNYINGFLAGDGCIHLTTKDAKFGFMRLQISQHTHNYKLMESLSHYFNWNLPSRHSKNSIQLTINFRTSNLFNHFNQYTLFGSKSIQLAKIQDINQLLSNNQHLEQVGRSRIWKSTFKESIINIQEDHSCSLAGTGLPLERTWIKYFPKD